jgi:hypothetical protein
VETGTLTDATALFNQGRYQEAKGAFAAVATNSPDYGVARCYTAFCQYELNDKLGSLNTLESPAVKAAVVPVEIREDLACARIDALFCYRQFGALLPKTRAFQTEHPASSCLATVKEYQLAGLFERGMKQSYDASLTADTNQFAVRWAESKANLEEFLSLATSFKATNYTVLALRDLQADRWAARLTLGEDVAEDIPPGDAAAREKVGLLRLRLYQKMQAEAIDQNLQLMADFLKEFPESSRRQRVELDMASIGFPKGKQLCVEADALEQAGDQAAATTKRNLARNYFEFQRTVQSNMQTNQTLGIEASDVYDLREDVLYGYYLEKDYATLAKLTASGLAESKSGELNWLLAKFFDGMILLNQSSPDPGAAAKTFDEIIAFGFTGKPDHDHLVLAAVKWRIHIAQESRDWSQAEQLTAWVQKTDCAKVLKASFLKTYGSLLPAVELERSAP